MWLVLTRAPLPDADYWPGRGILAAVDAVGWPLAWCWVATHVPAPTGIVGPMLIALALLCAVGRLHRALWLNHRYRFTTWRWGRWLLGLLAIGFVLQLTLRL